MPREQKAKKRAEEAKKAKKMKERGRRGEERQVVKETAMRGPKKEEDGR